MLHKEKQLYFLTAHSQSFSSIDVATSEVLIVDSSKSLDRCKRSHVHRKLERRRDQACSRELSKRSQENPLTSFCRRPSVIQGPLTRLQLFNA